MSGTATVPAVTIDATGIHAPTFEDHQNYLVDSFQGIYGADIYLGNDCQDGQLLGIFALAAINATNAVVASYNSYSPAGAQGAGLASAVKINGLTKLVPSYSTADLLIVGQAGRIITNGSAKDAAGYIWALPAAVVIPLAGQIIVTATCRTAGAIAAAPGAISQINTVTLGWQTVSNPQAAAPGAPAETDATLRARQAVSTALPARTVLESIVAGVLSVPGVSACQPYENDSYVTDGNGLPSHSIALVVQGGDAQAIANIIAAKKTPGAGTVGTVAQQVVDAYGLAHTIRFYQPALVPITVAITVKATAGYSTAVGADVQAGVASYGAGFAIGQDVPAGELYSGANLAYGAGQAPYRVTALSVSRDGVTFSADVPITFYELATFSAANVLLTVQ